MASKKLVIVGITMLMFIGGILLAPHIYAQQADEITKRPLDRLLKLKEFVKSLRQQATDEKRVIVLYKNDVTDKDYSDVEKSAKIKQKKS